MPSFVMDSSALISLVETCNSGCIEFLSKQGAVFFITQTVKNEVITNPMQIRKFQLSALRLKKLLTENQIKIFHSKSLTHDKNKVLYLANSLLYANGKPLKVLHEGEAECLAAFSSAKMDCLVIDEKTTRLLIENPFRLRDVLQTEYAQEISLNNRNLDSFKEFTKNIIVARSSEIIAAAAKRGFFKAFHDDEENAFHAATQALREAGCSLSDSEIEEYKQIKI